MDHGFELDARGVYRLSAFQSFDWLEHGFGTAKAGHWPEPDRLALVKQVHSNRVVAAEDQSGVIAEGDALVTAHTGRMIGVRTADCVPILLADTRRRAVAAIHSGWRGTAGNIVGRTISVMASRFGTRPADVVAAIGPAIGERCYEVGPEVALALARWNPRLSGTKSHTRVSLAATICAQLEETGVGAQQVFDANLCTFCTPGLESFRRDGQAAGRMLAAIGVR